MGKTITAGFISDTINGIGINSSIKCNNDNLNNNTSRSVAYVVMHYKMQKRIKNPLHKYTYRIIIMHNYSENIQLYASAPTKTCREEKLRSLF